MTFDALIVGAGILGCSAAWHLARRGLRVGVIERESAAGRGSTARSTAIIRQRYSHPAAMALALEGLRTWERWPELVPADEHGRRAALKQVGVLFLLPEGEPSTRPLADTMGSLGIRAEVLGRDALVSAFPSLAFPGDEAVEGLYEAEGGFVDDPTRATADVARAAERAGVGFCFGSRVVEVLTEWREGGLAIRGVRDQHGDTHESHVLVNCAGPHSAWLNVAARTPLALATVPLRQVVVDGVSPALAAARGPVPVIADLLLGYYLRPDPARVRIGAVWPQDETEFIVDPDQADAEVPRSVIAGRIAAAKSRLPALDVIEPHGIVGVYDVTAQDWYPVVDRTDTRGYFVAIGTSGAWFKAGPVIGQLVSELVLAQLAGRDTDRDPLEVTLPFTGHKIPLQVFSRRRRPVALSYGGGVLG